MGITFRYIVIAVSCLLITACQKTPVGRSVVPSGFESYISDEGYSINIPLGFSFAEKAPSNTYFYFGYPDNNPLNISTIELHPLRVVCDTSITGVSSSQVSIESSEKSLARWGYVDFFDTYNSGEGGWDFDGDPPLCRPPGVPGDAAYALCAEKDGKTVVICISQQKDNPELAKQIFESFRWTDGEGAGGE